MTKEHPHRPLTVHCCPLGRQYIDVVEDEDGDGYQGHHELGRREVLFCPFCGRGLPGAGRSEGTNPHREVAVHIHFDTSKMTNTQRRLIFDATTALKAAGIGFDTVGGGGGYDWEWDWSLSGPVKVVFKNFVQDDPKNRYLRKHGGTSPADQSSMVNATKHVQDMIEDMDEEEPAAS